MKTSTLTTSREELTLDDEALDAPVDAPQLSLPGLRAGWWRWSAPVVLLALAAFLFVSNGRHDAEADASKAARTSVTGHVEELLSYDYREIDTDLEREQKWLTGSFADDYASLVTDKIAPAAKDAKVVTEAKVVTSGVISAHADEVELLLFVNVTTRSSELADPRVSGSRLVVTADLVDGAWRISALDPV